jgi:hypothetical protein
MREDSSMKRIVLLTLFVSAAAAAGYGLYPDEATLTLNLATNATLRVWDSVEANPFPVMVALGTFLLTVIYHKLRGKSLRESVEVAATRVTIVPVPRKTVEDQENRVVKRAKARATRAQLLADQIGLQNRQRKLPEDIVKAEKDTCYSQQALADAERALMMRRKAHEEAVAKLEALQKENAARKAELTEIEAELKKLADQV